VDELAVLDGPVAGQVVDACPGVGVDDPIGSVLEIEVVKDVDQNGVLEDVGMVAGMEGVSVTEQERAYIKERASGSVSMASVNTMSQPQCNRVLARKASLTVQAAIL